MRHAHGLGGQFGDHVQTVAAVGGNGFEIGLDSGSAAGVGTGDGQDFGIGFLHDYSLGIERCLRAAR